MDKTFSELIITVIAVVVVAIGMDFLTAIFIKMLWNWLMPTIFNLSTITYWQAWGLSVLVSLLAPMRINTRKDD